MRRLLERTLAKMTRPVLGPGLDSKLGKFRDILLHDGSSFALKDALNVEWPGRFTKNAPAAVELHVTMSAFDDNPIHITLAPDKEAERALGPKAEDLRDCLLREDRGYEHRSFFLDMQAAGGFFIVRGNKAIRPIVLQARDLRGRRVRHLEGKLLSWEKRLRIAIPLVGFPRVVETEQLFAKRRQGLAGRVALDSSSVAPTHAVLPISARTLPFLLALHPSSMF